MCRCAQVAELLGISTAETVLQVEVDQGDRSGVSSEESAEIKRLKRENAELKRANAILKAASVFFAASLSRFLCKRLVRFCSIYRCWLMRSG